MIRVYSTNWRIVIPNLQQYKDASSQQLYKLRCLILQRLKHRPQDKRSHMKSQFDRGLRYYHIAVQHHANGIPHLDILLIYDKSIRRQLVDFDFLYKHGNITTYRKLNQAILDYGKKEDKDALSNLLQDKVLPSGQSVNQMIEVQDLKKDSYRYLQLEMLKDPLHFNLEQYVRLHDLNQYLPSWTSLKTRIKDSQVAAANIKLRSKSGFKYIDKALIESNLNSDQLKMYHSWSGYQTIVNYLNQIITHGGYRKMKTLNLLITGPASVGKTSLFHNPNHEAHENPIQDYIAVYPMGMSTWFPQYRSGVYKLILWNEAKLTSYAYDTILKLLQGSYLDLPTKGGVAPKRDNPLIIMTSNLTLEQMIQQKFGYNKAYEQMARKNLAVRVENVVVPPGYDLFLLQKLLV